MAQSELTTQIRAFIFEKFPLARKQNVKDSDALLETGVLDSLGVLDLVGFLDQTYSIGISDDELLPDNFQTIERIAAFVERKKNGGA